MNQPAAAGDHHLAVPLKTEPQLDPKHPQDAHAVALIDGAFRAAGRRDAEGVERQPIDRAVRVGNRPDAADEKAQGDRTR